jgi:hypothetical protein
MYGDREFSFERPNWEQLIHDLTVQKVAEKIRRKGHDVTTNMNSRRNNVIKKQNTTCYPDISVYRNINVENIYEVETTNSVNNEAAKKWKLCSTGCKAFFLIVPEDKLKESKKLARQHKIEVKDFITYSLKK